MIVYFTLPSSIIVENAGETTCVIIKKKFPICQRAFSCGEVDSNHRPLGYGPNELPTAPSRDVHSV